MKAVSISESLLYGSKSVVKGTAVAVLFVMLAAVSVVAQISIITVDESKMITDNGVAWHISLVHGIIHNDNERAFPAKMSTFLVACNASYRECRPLRVGDGLKMQPASNDAYGYSLPKRPGEIASPGPPCLLVYKKDSNGRITFWTVYISLGPPK
jgi:hypothetical protein